MMRSLLLWITALVHKWSIRLESSQSNLLIVKGPRLGVAVVRSSAALMNERCQPVIVVVEEVAGLGDPPLVVSPHMA